MIAKKIPLRRQELWFPQITFQTSSAAPLLQPIPSTPMSIQVYYNIHCDEAEEYTENPGTEEDNETYATAQTAEVLMLPNKATMQDTTRTHSLRIEEEDGEAKSNKDEVKSKEICSTSTAKQDTSATTSTYRTTMTTRGSRRKDVQATQSDKPVINADADDNTYIQDMDKYLHDFGTERRRQARSLKNYWLAAVTMPLRRRNMSLCTTTTAQTVK